MSENKQTVLADSQIAQILTSIPGYPDGLDRCLEFARAVESAVLSKLRAAAEPSVEEINREMANAGWQNSAIRQADLPNVVRVVRALLSRYGRPAGDSASGVISVQECDAVPYVHPEFGPGIFFTEDCRIAAPVAAQKADDARDAERWREVKRRATKKTAYDRYGNGAYWSVGVFSGDSRQTFGETIDAAIAQQRKEG